MNNILVNFIFLKKYLDLAATDPLLDLSGRLQLVPGHQRSLDTYPDGSVQLDDRAKEALEEFERLTSGVITGRAEHKTVSYNYKLLNEDHFNLIMIPASYFELLGREGLVIRDATEDLQSCHTNELHRQIKFIITFRHRLVNASIIEFAGVIRDWAEAVRSCGLFGEGPASVVGSYIDYEKLKARFTVDFKNSGHKTFNWLIISMLNYAMIGLPIQVIAFDTVAIDQGSAQSEWDRASRVSLDLLPLVPINIEGSRVPGGLVPEMSYTSSRLVILTAPGFDWRHDWQSLRLTVFFSGSLDTTERMLFSRLIDGWISVGLFGGLGGDGIRYAGDLKFFDSDDCAALYLDMGDSLREVAMPLLIRMLESFDSDVAPIEAVVFGHIGGG